LTARAEAGFAVVKPTRSISGAAVPATAYHTVALPHLDVSGFLSGDDPDQQELRFGKGGVARGSPARRPGHRAPTLAHPGYCAALSMLPQSTPV
jgi:hypothetical protein